MMKTLYGLSVIGLTVLIIGCGAQKSKSDATAQATASMSVDQLVKEGEHVTGPLTVSGMVRSASTSEGILTLIDAKEYEACGLSNCCLFVPVRWRGDMPAVEARVSVTGTIEKSADGLVLVASAVTTEAAAPATPQ